MNAFLDSQCGDALSHWGKQGLGEGAVGGWGDAGIKGKAE